MRYIHVNWAHDRSGEPVELYSELDDESWEVSKVEVFGEGKLGIAGSDVSSGSTRLGLEPVPSLEEIALDGQFRPEEFTRGEFERIWELALSAVHANPEWNLTPTTPREG